MSKKAKSPQPEEEISPSAEQTPEAENSLPEVEPDPTEELKGKLNEALAQVTEYKNMAQRVQAEFENFRKRNQESVRIAREEGGNDAIIAFLPVLDSVDIALNMVQEERAQEGLKLIRKKAEAVLEKYGIVEIAALEREFDPAFHNAVMQVEDEERAGKVIEVLQKGYQRNGKVIRYAMVKVAKKTE